MFGSLVADWVTIRRLYPVKQTLLAPCVLSLTVIKSLTIPFQTPFMFNLSVFRAELLRKGHATLCEF